MLNKFSFPKLLTPTLGANLTKIQVPLISSVPVQISQLISCGIHFDLLNNALGGELLKRASRTVFYQGPRAQVKMFVNNYQRLSSTSIFYNQPEYIRDVTETTLGLPPFLIKFVLSLLEIRIKKNFYCNVGRDLIFYGESKTIKTNFQQ